MNTEKRVTRVTSSNAYKLIKTGRGSAEFSAPGLTYIEEKQIEKRLGKCLDVTGAYSEAMAWGNFMELVVYNALGIEYKISSKDTMEHPKHGKYWSGTPDLYIDGVLIAEIKCYQLKKWCQYTDAITKPLTDTYTLEDKLNDLKDNFAQEYWQIVSNAHIMGVTIGEAITFMPYESQADEIKSLAAAHDGPDQWKYRFIAEKPIEFLPFLKDGGYYKDVNTFRFEIPKEDLDLLEERIVKAGKIIHDEK